MDFPGAQMVKKLPTMQETWVWFLGGEDPLEKATHSSILAWRIPWTEKPGGLQTTIHWVAKGWTQLSDKQWNILRYHTLKDNFYL